MAENDDNDMRWVDQRVSFEFIEEPKANMVVPRVAGLREALLSLDRWNLPDLVKKRACVMRSVPRFLKGLCRDALRVALEEASAEQLSYEERAWKLSFCCRACSCTVLHEEGCCSKKEIDSTISCEM